MTVFPTRLTPHLWRHADHISFDLAKKMKRKGKSILGGSSFRTRIHDRFYSVAEQKSDNCNSLQSTASITTLKTLPFRAFDWSIICRRNPSYVKKVDRYQSTKNADILNDEEKRHDVRIISVLFRLSVKRSRRDRPWAGDTKGTFPIKRSSWRIMQWDNRHPYLSIWLLCPTRYWNWRMWNICN